MVGGFIVTYHFTGQSRQVGGRVFAATGERRISVYPIHSLVCGGWGVLLVAGCGGQFSRFFRGDSLRLSTVAGMRSGPLLGGAVLYEVSVPFALWGRTVWCHQSICFLLHSLGFLGSTFVPSAVRSTSKDYSFGLFGAIFSMFPISGVQSA